MTADVVDIRKATNQISGLISAVGLEQAWTAVANAQEDQLGADERDAVMREITTLQLVKAGELVKTTGLTPEVVQLLQLLINLMAGDPGLAPGTPTEDAPPPVEQAHTPAPPPAAAAPAAAPAPVAPTAKDLPAPLANAGTAPLHDDPADLPDANKGTYGQTADGEKSFTETGKDVTQKDLPPPQKDPQPSSAQKDPPIATPQADAVRGGSGGGGKEGGDANALDAPQKDAPLTSPQKDPQPGTPTRKAAQVQKDARTGLPLASSPGFWHEADIGKKTNPLLDRPRHRKTTR